MGINLIKQKSHPVRPGARVRLTQMDDPYTKLRKGDEGTIDYVDDAGVIHVKWDNGSNLGLLEDVDEFVVLNENANQYKPFPKGEDRNNAIGDRNAKLYQQAEDRMMEDDGEEGTPNNDSKEDSEEEEIDPYEGKERRFRISFYVDIHVPMTANLEYDRQVAEQAGSEILKNLHNKDVSNAFLGGVAHNPFATMPDSKEFDRL